MDLVQLIHDERVRVPAAFIGGGFSTTAMHPSDVDTSLIVDDSRISNPRTYSKVAGLAAGTKTTLGLQLDAFVIPWHPDGTEPGGNPKYFPARGKWDDFWQRKVAKLDRDPPQRRHAMPVRGYLEVLIDGYS